MLEKARSEQVVHKHSINLWKQSTQQLTETSLAKPAKKYKKVFYAALSEAMYAWDEDDTKNLYEAMKNRIDVNMDEFQLMWYYRRSYFVN